jgi:hypothetical protein
MPDTIKTRTILIKEGTLLPEILRFESEPCAAGRRLVENLDVYRKKRNEHRLGAGRSYRRNLADGIHHR